MYYIGIDVGTSSVKLILTDEKLNIIKTVSGDYPVFYPHPGWSEQNPEDWWQVSLKCMESLLDGIKKEDVAGISFGGQMHGLVILDENDNVIRPAILWNDGRTAKETDYLNTVIGKDKLSEYTGNIAFAGFTAPKILWVKENEPENFKKIKKIMLPKDYLAYKFTGVFSTDFSDAAGMLLLDVKNKCWSKEMLDICGINEKLLPKLFESYECIGTVRCDVAAKLGISDKVKVAAGAADNAAAAIGTGTVGNGRCNVSLGTSGTLLVSGENFAVDEKNVLHAFCHADGGFYLMGCMLSAASCGTWWMKKVIDSRDYKKEESYTALGDNRVIFLPYLMGERSPHNDPAATGAFLGITPETTREEMTAAIFEGVTFGIRDSLEVVRSLGIAPSRITLCGGGAKSVLWQNIVANILNVEVDLPETENGPAMGGAVLAAVCCGEYPSVEKAADTVRNVIKTIKPDKEIASKYEKKYEVFKSLYPALKPIFPSLKY